MNEYCCGGMQLALAGESRAPALLPDEENWEVLWPNTPIPNGLRELLKPGPQGSNYYFHFIFRCVLHKLKKQISFIVLEKIINFFLNF